MTYHLSEPGDTPHGHVNYRTYAAAAFETGATHLLLSCWSVICTFILIALHLKSPSKTYASHHI